jgi:predicted RNA polymerase sigma factor
MLERVGSRGAAVDAYGEALTLAGTDQERRWIEAKILELRGNENAGSQSS